MKRKVTVLFDGQCGLCHRAVRFAARRDIRHHLTFVPADSSFGCALRHRFGVQMETAHTLITVRDGSVSFRSTAALEIARVLDRPWNWFAHFRWIPRFLRDPVYRLVARYRHIFFGKKESCDVTDPARLEE